MERAAFREGFREGYAEGVLLCIAIALLTFIIWILSSNGASP